MFLSVTKLKGNFMSSNIIIKCQADPETQLTRSVFVLNGSEGVILSGHGDNECYFLFEFIFLLALRLSLMFVYCI